MNPELQLRSYCCFFFRDTATTEIYTLSLHDALPICRAAGGSEGARCRVQSYGCAPILREPGIGLSVNVAQVLDRKSTRLNSSHMSISYAVFCLKKKKKYRVHSHRV